jgi:hypothetical protein
MKQIYSIYKTVTNPDIILFKKMEKKAIKKESSIIDKIVSEVSRLKSEQAKSYLDKIEKNIVLIEGIRFDDYSDTEKQSFYDVLIRI